MGRRKIEIKPIRDDRNRSVTFLKRKGGLFKKAHELSVLCQVDVAVIIFGNNKKLYEYSSSDINEVVGRFQYYGGAHEHKGPQDFADKGGGDDDDDDDDGGDEVDARGATPQPEPAMMPMQHHPGFQHVRHVTPQNSPPMHNGAMPAFQRGASPMPPQNISRPSSRASQQQGGHMRRTSSNLVPVQHQAGVPPPQSYAYTPNPPFYNPQANPQMQRPPGQPGPHPQGSTYPPPYHPAQGAPHPQMQQVMVQDTRRSSMPPAGYAPQPGPPPQANMQRHPSQEHLQPPQQPQRHPSPRPQQQQQQPPQQRPTPSPQPPQQQFASPPVPQTKPLPAHAKSQSMFTPIDDSRSMLAQHWGASSNSNAEPARSEPNVKVETRAASLDNGALQREMRAERGPTARGDKPNGVSPPQPSPSLKSEPPQRTASTPLARSSTGQADAKRPRLKVQIPSEQSGDEGGTASAPDDSTATSQANKDTAGGETKQQPQQSSQPSHGVVLPPPSPSAGALLSAGAQGPPNPFARPPPPMSTNPHAANRDASSNTSTTNNNNNNNNIETPISALPSRFMSDNLLPSPSTFYPEWGFGRQGDSNMLPSPLTFATPVAGNGGGWREEDRKREREREGDGSGGEGGGGKRAKN